MRYHWQSCSEKFGWKFGWQQCAAQSCIYKNIRCGRPLIPDPCVCVRTTIGPHLLSHDALHHALLVHGPFPLCQDDARCVYRMQVYSNMCNRSLVTFGQQIHTCSFGPQMRNHNVTHGTWSCSSRPPSRTSCPNSWLFVALARLNVPTSW